MQEEIWKDIPGYEGLYQVSNLGRVYSLPKQWVSGKYNSVIKHNGKILKQNPDKRGYLSVSLNLNGNDKTRLIHQLVAEAFLNHKRCGYKLVIDHINNEPTDNRVENLQIVTQRFNASKDRNRESKYIGVCRNKRDGNWTSQITINGKRMRLGNFETELEASEAYQNKLKDIDKDENN
jgi:hypothetical protein